MTKIATKVKWVPKRKVGSTVFYRVRQNWFRARIVRTHSDDTFTVRVLFRQQQKSDGSFVDAPAYFGDLTRLHAQDLFSTLEGAAS